MAADRNQLTKAMRWEIADRLAEERLPMINASLEDVCPTKSFYAEHGKRIIDIFLALFALIVTFPINFLIAVLTWIDVGWPLFFKQNRLGKSGKIFHIFKFRNMKNITDNRGELLPATQRVTKFGKFVRRTSLDELLNFWSILKGDMSIIGPRPLVPEYGSRYNKRHKMRMAVRPGLECPPRKDLDHVWTWQEQFDNDVWYVENISFRTDCLMLWRLVKFTFDRKSTKIRSVSGRGTFIGYSLEGQAITLAEVPQEMIDEVMGISET